MITITNTGEHQRVFRAITLANELMFAQSYNS